MLSAAAAMMIASPALSVEENDRAAQNFTKTEINGGVIVHLGATDGEFTAALKINDPRQYGTAWQPPTAVCISVLPMEGSIVSGVTNNGC
jgi:hypothetical protein